MHGFLLGKPLMGDSGKPFPKGERREKVKLAMPLGDAYYKRLKAADREHKLGLIDHQQVKPAIVYHDHDVIASHNVTGVSDKYEKRGVLRLHHGPEAQLPGFTFANDPNADKPKEAKSNRRTKYKRAEDRLAPVVRVHTRKVLHLVK
jgi:hypothetical protein